MHAWKEDRENHNFDFLILTLPSPLGVIGKYWAKPKRQERDDIREQPPRLRMVVLSEGDLYAPHK